MSAAAPGGWPISSARRSKGELRLREVIAGIAAPKGRITAFSVEPQVIIDNDSSNRYTVIEVAGLDRIGLLYELTEALFGLNLNIVSAHITTFGERAVDVFYVTDLTGAKITAEDRRRVISRKSRRGAGARRRTSWKPVRDRNRDQASMALLKSAATVGSFTLSAGFWVSRAT